MRKRLRKRWLIGVMAAAASCVATAASAQVLPNPMDFGVVYEELAFEAADTDGNNLVSEAEFVRDAAAAFAGLDTNHDGKLTPDELRADDPVTFATLPATFAKIDANGDGVLTFDEVMTFKMKAFRAADKNQDGALSFDEMVSTVRSEVGK
jgi:Ca2+-binding EF-hand superfamily protein